MPFEPKDPPCRCPDEKQQTFRRGTAEDEEFYLEGVREMFAHNNEEWNTETADRLFYRRVCAAGGVLIAGPGKRGYVLSEVRRNRCNCVLSILLQAGSTAPFVPRGSAWRNRFVFISDVFVGREWRGRRLAGRMIERAIASFPREQFPEIFAAVYAGNEPSLALFRGLKFELFHSIVERRVGEKREEPKMVWRTFSPSTDRALIGAGLATASDRPIEDEEAEYGRFCHRFSESTRVFVDAGGAAIAWATFEITSDTPYGVLYGEYYERFGFVYHMHVAAEKEIDHSLGLQVLQLLEGACRAAGVAVMKSGFGASESAGLLLRRAGFKDCVYLLRRDNV
jgi:ribosomal protein S18 acetylase RimI-like enzyme